MAGLPASERGWASDARQRAGWLARPRGRRSSLPSPGRWFPRQRPPGPAHHVRQEPRAQRSL